MITEIDSSQRKKEEKRCLIFISRGAMAIDGEYDPAELYGVKRG